MYMRGIETIQGPIYSRTDELYETKVL